MGVVSSICEGKGSHRESDFDDPDVIKNPLAKQNAKPKKEPPPRQSSKVLTIEDFRIVKILGEGSFGKVKLVQEKKSGEYYALKAFKKEDILKKNMMESVLSEKDILKGLKHNFVVRLRYAFQGKTKVYMVMDFCQGGDLAAYLQKHRKLSEEATKFYAAEVILALQYLHDELDVIHRDIKPENIMFASDGHIKLTDFGLAKSTQKTFSLCGTPEYVAPEIILGEGYGTEVDWWSLGCLLFQMVAGFTPFYKSAVSQLPLDILQKDPPIPADFSPDLKDLVVKLLSKKPKQRLGANGAEEVKKHKFFQGVDWDKVQKKDRTPPFIPTLSGREDVSYFSNTYDAETTKESSKEPTSSTNLKSSGHLFPAFTYVEKDPLA